MIQSSYTQARKSMYERKKLLWGNKLDDLELSRLIKQANLSRGGKPAKYPQLDKHVEIVKLIENDVQLPFILKWLFDEKGEKLVLNTLRKYVVFKIGRPAYEAYLKRNGWMKTKRKPEGGVAKKIEHKSLSPINLDDVPLNPDLSVADEFYENFRAENQK